MLEIAEHQRERRMLGRVEEYSRTHTPWGTSQGATVYADGVTSHSTAGHGGFRLSAERNRKVHPMLRSAGGWYEEDAEWAIVAITFPHLFTAFERRCAERTIKDGWPDAWEAIFGTILQPGESREKDRRSFDTAHAHHWIVVSAITSKQVAGFVEVVATPGGKCAAGTEERRFLVPSDEYRIGRFGFVTEARDATAKASNDLRDEDLDGPVGFDSAAQRKREFAADMALQSHALRMAAEGAVAAYEHVVGERWKPFERPVENPGQTLDRKAAAVQMAAFG